MGASVIVPFIIQAFVLAAVISPASLIFAETSSVIVSPTATVEPVTSLKVIVRIFPAAFQAMLPTFGALPQLCPLSSFSFPLIVAAVITGLFVFWSKVMVTVSPTASTGFELPFAATMLLMTGSVGAIMSMLMMPMLAPLYQRYAVRSPTLFCT